MADAAEAEDMGRGIIGVDVDAVAAIWFSSLRILARYLDLAFSKAVIRAALACFRSLTSSSFWD